MLSVDKMSNNAEITRFKYYLKYVNTSKKKSQADISQKIRRTVDICQAEPVPYSIDTIYKLYDSIPNSFKIVITNHRRIVNIDYHGTAYKLCYSLKNKKDTV